LFAIFDRILLVVMNNMIFDYFDQEGIRSKICRHFNLTEHKVQEYIFKKNCGTINKLTYEDFITDFNIDLNKTIPNDYYIKCKHCTTSRNNFNDIKRLGLLNSRDVLIQNTELNDFFKENDISFDFKSNKLIIDNIEYELKKYDEYSYRDLKYWLKQLYVKLYDNKGELEMFVFADNNQIQSYSTIQDYPEIIDNINNILQIVRKNYVDQSIISKWNCGNKKIAIITFDVKLSNVYLDYQEVDIFMPLVNLINTYLLKLFISSSSSSTERLGIVKNGTIIPATELTFDIVNRY